jgi:probable nitrogen fixation protein
MRDWAEKLITADDPALRSPFIVEVVRQMRAIDSYGTWEDAGDHEILDPFVMTKERKREVPITGDPDALTLARLKAWYNALAVSIEARTGLMAAPMLNLTSEGFGRAIISVGKLIVADKSLRDVHRFGFKSLEAMAEEAEKLVSRAAELIENHRDVAKL